MTRINFFICQTDFLVGKEKETQNSLEIAVFFLFFFKWLFGHLRHRITK